MLQLYPGKWVSNEITLNMALWKMMVMNDGMCQAEMFLDSDTMRAFIIKDPVPWYGKEDYRCKEPDPSTFPGRWAASL